MTMCGGNIQKVTTERGLKVTEKRSIFVDVRSMISELKKDSNITLQRYVKQTV
jgi:hypothetical protein